MGEIAGPFRAQVQKREIVLKENARPSKGSERTKNSAHERVKDVIDADPKSNRSGWCGRTRAAAAAPKPTSAAASGSGTRRASSSSSTAPPNHPAYSAACADCATSQPHAASSTMNRRRASGHFGSSGRYAPPEISTPYTPTTCSSERCSCSATTPSGATPRAASHAATPHRVAAPLERHRVRRARRLRRHQIVHAKLSREERRRVVEPAQHELRFRRRQQRQRPRVDVVRRARQRLRQRCQLRCQPLDALAREEVAVVLDHALDATRSADGRRQCQFYLGHVAAAAAAAAAAVVLSARIPADRLHLHLQPEAATALRTTAPASIGLPREYRLEDGVARRVVHAPRQLVVHELLERQRRVRYAAHSRLACRAQQCAHCAAARRRHAQRQHVDEVADQPFGARRVAPVIRHAHHRLLLPRVPAQQQRPQREHQLEERAPVRARGRRQPRHHRRRQRHSHAAAAEGLPRGAREVERQLERRQRALAQVLAPVRAVRPQVRRQ
eukprot:scaffold11383_cov70-Phaeocystis_antarctica.AAC.4